MDSDIEWKANIVQVAPSFAVEPADRLQFFRVHQLLRYAQQILVGVRLDLRGRDLPRVAHHR